MTVQTNNSDSPHYDAITIVLHWLVAVLVGVLWFGGETLGWFSAAAMRADARSLHILFGTALGVIGAVRFIWRLSFGRPLPAVDQGAVGIAANLTHQGLYVLLAAMVFVGMLLLWSTGDSAFNLFDVAPAGAANVGQASQLQSVHAMIGWAIAAVVALHVGGVLYHRFVQRDDVLARMLLRR
jgi:cytochrome b561